MDSEQKRRLRGEHIESYTQDAPIGALSKIPDIRRGLKRWGPDLAALPGDLLDMLAYAGQKVARGQSERPVPSLGAGAATRAALSKTPRRDRAELTEHKDPSMVEEAVRFMNPMMWGNPLKIAQGPLGKVMAVLGGDMSGGLGVIKGKGGNWHPDVDPRRALEPMMRAKSMSLEEALKLGVPPESYELAKTMDNWIQGPLAKYMMRDMATVDDPIRKLADQGILHVKPDELNFNMSSYGKWPSEGQTFHAKSDTAKAWEGASDNVIGSTPRWMLAPEPGSSPFARENPWALNLPEDTPIYSLFAPEHVPDDLGLDRLTNTVYEALIDGKLRPEQLKSGSFGVEAAVRFADKVRREKEAAAEAEALKALVNEATVEHKAYPEGYRWIEFKAPDPDAWEAANSHLSPAEYDKQVAEFRRNRYGKLQQALNAEGDYMGHCIGNYCDDVLSGNTRLFSLRDPKGRSVVSVEARKTRGMGGDGDVEDEAYNWVLQHHPELDDESDEFMELAMEKAIELAAQPLDRWTIGQIKGSGKKDPMQKITPEDLKLVQPYIQDFLNSGNYDNVRDLSNAGLHDMKGLYGDNLPKDVKRFMTADEQQQFNQQYPDLESTFTKELNSGDWEVEFAEGGLVRAPEFFNNLDMFLRG